MIKEFIIRNFFLIAKLIVCTGVSLCIYAGLTKRKSNKKIDNADISESIITNSKEKKIKNTRILMGVGVTAVLAGIILLVLGVVAIITFIYVLIHLKPLLDALE